MPIMFWLTGLTALIAGLILLKLGLWPRRRGDTPYCRKCGYNLTGLTSDRCPECGTTISPATTLHGERHRSTGKIILGNAVLILALAWLAAPLTGINTWRLYPTFMVVPYLQSPKYTTAQAAWNEIERRIAAGKLSRAQCRPIFDPLTRLQLVVRPQITRGDPAVFDVKNTVGNWAAPNIAEVVRPIELSIDSASQHAGDRWCSLGVGHGETGWPIPFDGPPGKHDLKVKFTIERYYLPAGRRFSQFKQGVLLDQRTMTLEGSFEILATRPADDIKLINRPELAKSIQNCIRLVRLRFRSDRQDRLFVYLDINYSLPENLAFDSFARINGREHPGDSLTVPGQYGSMGTGSHFAYDGPPVQSADIIFRPSKTAARRTADMFEIWDGELVYKDVPVEVVDDKLTTQPATPTAPSRASRER